MFPLHQWVPVARGARYTCAPMNNPGFFTMEQSWICFMITDPGSVCKMRFAFQSWLCRNPTSRLNKFADHLTSSLVACEIRPQIQTNFYVFLRIFSLDCQEVGVKVLFSGWCVHTALCICSLRWWWSLNSCLNSDNSKVIPLQKWMTGTGLSNMNSVLWF